jgi:hypothetical protein
VSTKQPRPRRRAAGHARRPRTPLRRRLGGRLPSRGRVLALLAFAAAVAGLVTLLNGPWLRVSSVAHAGARYTSPGALDEVLGSLRGTSLLALDTDAVLRRVRQLPAVSDARVEVTLPGTLRVTIREKAPALIWRTGAAQLLVAADGSIVDWHSSSEVLGDQLRRLPLIQDSRPRPVMPHPGDLLPAVDVRMAMRLLDLDPKVIGSRAKRVEVSIDPTYGFVIESPAPPWRAALGFYERDPHEDRAAADARLDQQLVAIRTLFAGRREWAVSWVDARNPGRVYWTP